MKRLFALLGVLVVSSSGLFAGGNADSTNWREHPANRGLMDSGWVVQFPTGSSDYFNLADPVYHGVGIPDSCVIDDKPLCAIGVSVADFGSGRTYATIGLFSPNIALDPTGLTPDLASPILAVSSPALSPPPLF